MHTLEEIRAEYRRLDTLCGADTSAIPVVLSTRMVKRLGSFRYPLNDRGAPPQITISAAVLAEDALFWNTIRHEYAHAVVWLRHPGEQHGHDALWRSVCQVIGCAPKATVPASGGQMALRKARARYTVRCKHCGQETFYLRKGRIVELLEAGESNRVRCRACGSHAFDLFAKK